MSKTYYLDSYNWIEIENNKITDMAIGEHYAGCRCNISQDSLEKCNNFKNCFRDIVLGLFMHKSKDYKEVKNKIYNNYKKIFDKIKEEF